MCLGLIPNHFVLLFLKDGCPLPSSSMEWNNHKSDERLTCEFEYLDQQVRFRELMKIEKGLKPPPPKKESNQVNHILCDTPEKPREEFQVIGEDEEDLISLEVI